MTHVQRVFPDGSTPPVPLWGCVCVCHCLSSRVLCSSDGKIGVGHCDIVHVVKE